MWDESSRRQTQLRSFQLESRFIALTTNQCEKIPVLVCRAASLAAPHARRDRTSHSSTGWHVYTSMVRVAHKRVDLASFHEVAGSQLRHRRLRQQQALTAHWVFANERCVHATFAMAACRLTRVFSPSRDDFGTCRFACLQKGNVSFDFDRRIQGLGFRWPTMH